MEPTVEVGDRILVNKLAFGVRLPLTDYWLGSVQVPERGSVVVIAPPEDDGPVLLKRVVAVAGDEVAVHGGRLFLDGQAVAVERAPELPWHQEVERLGAPHRIELAFGGGPDFGPTRVPRGQMLVMGDNRGNSRDGRSFGFVDVDSVRGRAVAVYVSGGSLTWRAL
jgi:signal peptidase I